MRRLFTPSLLLCTVFLPPPAAADESWSDPATGRSYVRLDAPLTWNDAYNACYQRGMVLYDARHVSETEQLALTTSPIMGELTWHAFFPNTPQEQFLATVWQTAEEEIIPTGLAGQVLVIQRKEGQAPMTVTEWRDTTEDLADSVCMTVPGFWYRCAMEVKCTYSHSHNPYSLRYHLADYGTNEGDAMRYIVKRIGEPPFSISEGACIPKTETAMCVRVFPRR